jgi:hypothetical protein
MRSSRIALNLALLFTVVLALSVVGYTERNPTSQPADEFTSESLIAAYHGPESLESPASDDQSGGIKEDVPEKYLRKYQDWKEEFLSTDAGRSQWAQYAKNPHFTLTITISRDNAEGATTGRYKWSDGGQLVAATITLGNRLDAGYPNPIYFPVMNSLGATNTSRPVDGITLAATKIAHEFGHVNRTLKADARLYQLQTQLIPQYNSIFLSNGRRASDPKLLELATRIGGTPVEIWEDREYWGEANAMVYLRDRITDDSTRCTLFSKIKHSVDLYAKDYEKRFFDVVRTVPGSKNCGW